MATLPIRRNIALLSAAVAANAAALALGAVVLVVVPALWILRDRAGTWLPDDYLRMA